jgi:hypothetical protein
MSPRSHSRLLGLACPGLIYLLGGGLGAQEQIHAFTGDVFFAELGTSVAQAGDINKDGYPDILVGAPRVGANLGGAAKVFSGRDGKLLYTFLGDGAGDGLGQSVASAGDVNKDGYLDVIAGAPQQFC